jgi:hypothetical protein
MGLLDELEQESQRRKAGQSDTERERVEREQVYKTQLEPAMQALYEYLTKLIQNLSYLKPRHAGRYEMPGYGEIVAYTEHDYELKISSQPFTKEITLNFSYVVATDECPALEAVGSAKIKALNATFQKFRLAGLGEFKKDEQGEMASAHFRARGKVPLSAVIAADAGTSQVRMTFTNFDALGTVSKIIGAAQFNEALFDEIGRYIAREPSNLFREELPDDYRRGLQQKIQQEQLRRKWEQKLAVQQAEELERLKRERGGGDGEAAEPGFLGKVKSLFRRI